MLAGTDSGLRSTRRGCCAREMRLLAGLGMGNAGAIAAATSLVADTLRMEDRGGHPGEGVRRPAARGGQSSRRPQRPGRPTDGRPGWRAPLEITPRRATCASAPRTRPAVTRPSLNSLARRSRSPTALGAGGGSAECLGPILTDRIEQALELLGCGDVREATLPQLAGRLDEEIAGPQHPLQDVLAELHVVDALEGDLQTLASEDAAAADQPLVGEHVPGEPPRDERVERQADPGDQRRPGDDPRTRSAEPVGRIRHEHPGQDDDGAEQHRPTGWQGEHPPVGSELTDDALALGQQALWISHGRILRRRHPERGKPRASLGRSLNPLGAPIRSALSVTPIPSGAEARSGGGPSPVLPEPEGPRWPFPLAGRSGPPALVVSHLDGEEKVDAPDTPPSSQIAGWFSRLKSCFREGRATLHDDSSGCQLLGSEGGMEHGRSDCGSWWSSRW